MSNTALGYQATRPIGTNNVFVGLDAGIHATTGHHNTFIGSRAGQTITTGHHNICIGADAGADLSPDSSWAVIIGKVVLSHPAGSWWRKRAITRRQHEALRRWINALINTTLNLPPLD